jgi:N-acetylmuramoyl-L-alanine amidase
VLALAAALLAALLALRGLGGGRPTDAAPPGGESLRLAGAASGACVVYPPASGDRHLTVFLDAGHGGPDPGTSGLDRSGRRVFEKTETLDVALRAAQLLRASGFRVVLSRTSDSTVAALSGEDLVNGVLTGSAEVKDLDERVACANAARADAALSIHFNGFDDPGVGGSQTFYDPDRPFADRSLKLATAVQDSLVRGLGLDDRGVSSDGDLVAETLTDQGAAYGHLILLGPAQPGLVPSPTRMPGALSEALFLTNPEEAQLVASSPTRVASALAAGVRAYFSG